MASEGLIEGPRSLVEDQTNKTSEARKEPSLRPEDLLTLDTPDQELIEKKNRWIQQFNLNSSSIEKENNEAENYWKGIHYGASTYKAEARPVVDNMIFEATETFLPEATKKNPEPVVMASNTAAGQALAKDVKTMLSYQADIQLLRLKLKRTVRYWTLYKLGVLKIGWSKRKNDIETVALRPQKLILDMSATIEDGGRYNGEYIGEYKKDEAEFLTQMFPAQADFISKKCDGKMGTKLSYIEWWTDKMLFYTMDDVVLGKFVNPHWNEATKSVEIDEFGQETEIEVPAKNHFDVPEMPYVFLSVFNLGKSPYDDTSLIQQNLSNQDEINLLNKQVIFNVRAMNNGIVLSGDHFTQEQSKQAADAMSTGDALWVPSGDINKAYKRDQAPALSSDVYNTLVDRRSELRNIFGVKGSSAQGMASEQTVRGKMIIAEKDASRIGGGISEYIEQVADRVFNWWVQMMYVYYDEAKYATVLGKEKAQDTVMLSSQSLTEKLSVSVKEGSMIPKDSLTRANQAIDLYSAGALSPIELFDALDYPDPRGTAKNTLMWEMVKSGALPPQVMFPDFPTAPMPVTPGMPITPVPGQSMAQVTDAG